MSIHDKDLFNGLEKWQISVERLKMFRPDKPFYVAFSGGKDSVAVKSIVEKSGMPADYHYHLTGIDPPELVRFIKTFDDVQIHLPEETIWKMVVRKKYPPTRVVRYCCQMLKERGGKDRRVITGVRWAESNRRKKRQMVEHCMDSGQGDKQIINPIIDWTDSEVWEYIKENDLKYCSLYDEGFRRLGCIMCPMTSHEKRIREAERWPKIAEQWKRTIYRCFEKRIADGDDMGEWTTGEDMWKWWLHNVPKYVEDPDQTTLFE